MTGRNILVDLKHYKQKYLRLFCKSNCCLITHNPLKINIVSASSYFDTGPVGLQSILSIHNIAPCILITIDDQWNLNHPFGCKKILIRIYAIRNSVIRILKTFPQNIPLSIF